MREASIDLSHSADREAQSILGWSDDLVAVLKRCLLALHNKSKLAAPELDELANVRLVKDSSGQLTPLGHNLAIRVLAETWQEGNELHAFLDRCRANVAGSVLEVGCGTGFASRSLRSPRPARR